MLHRCLRTAAPLAFALGAAAAASAEVFPPITGEERALTAAPRQPNAPPVVLFRNGELRMMDPSRQDVSSQLVVRVRLKILTEAGREQGNVHIEHSGSVRLQGFEGRTVLPDGTVVPVPSDATFKRTTSRARRFYVTSVAFPSVQVGAILDYQYSVRWDSIFFLEPWFFQDHVPVLHSEIAYEVPKSLQVSIWQSDPLHAGIKSETAKSVLGTRVRAWADHLAPVPEEVHSLPFADMAAQLMMVPTAYSTSYALERLFESWPATCKVFEDDYEQARRKDGNAARQAREIAARAGAAPVAAASPTPSLQRRQAAAIYDFVRDEIATEDANRVWLPQYSTAGAGLDPRRGEPAETAGPPQAPLA